MSLRLRPFGATLLLLALLFSAMLTGVTVAHASTLVTAPTRAGVTFDDARGLLYIAAGDRVLRYDTASGQMLRPFIVGGQLRGIDISPDGRTLAAADAQGTGDYYGGTSFVHLIDLDTGSDTLAPFGRGYTSGNTDWVAWGIDGRLFVVQSGQWETLVRYDPTTGITDSVANWVYGPHIVASRDRSVIGLSQEGISDGAWGVYHMADGSYASRDGYTNGTSTYNSDFAVSPDGSHYAFVAGQQVQVFGPDYARIKTFSPVGGQAIGVEYSPTGTVLFVAIGGTQFVAAYDATTLTEIARYDMGTSLGPDYHAWPWPTRMALPSDGGVLSATVPGGVRLARIRPAVTGVVRSSYEGLPVESALVSLWRQRSGSWSVEATTATGVNGSWTYSTEDTSALRVSVSDPGGSHDSAWVGGNDVATASSFIASLAPSPSADATLTLAHPAEIDGTVTSSWDDAPIPGVEVSLYGDSDLETPIATAETDAEGAYRFAGIAPSRYRIGFSDPTGAHVDAFFGGATTAAAGTLVHLTGPDTYTADQTLTFIPLIVRGAVHSDFFGHPVSGAVVEIWREGDGGSHALETTLAADNAGSWSFETDDDTPVRVRVLDPLGMHDPVWIGGTSLATADDIVPSRDEPVAAHDTTMALTSPGAIGGKVGSTDAGAYLGGITVTAYMSASGASVAGSATTAADGTYLLGGLGAGAYRIGFSDPSGAHQPAFFGGATLAAATIVPLTGPQTVSADATLTFIPLKLAGTVTSSYRAKPVSGALLEVWRHTGASWACETTLTADSAGSWTYSTDATQPVRVRAIDPHGAHDPAWLGGNDVATAADKTPTRGTPARADLTMTMTHPATISGTVTSSKDGSPVSGAVATLYADDAGALTSLATTVAADDGTYSFGGLGPSTYRIGFTDPAGQHDPLSPGAPVTVTGPATLTFDATMQFIPYQIGGTVSSDAFDLPLPGAVVEIWREPTPGSWALEDIAVADFAGQWSYSTDSGARARIRATDPGAMCDAAWFGGTTVHNASNVTPTRDPADTTDVTLHVSHAAVIGGTVLDSYSSDPVAGIRVSLYPADQGPVEALESTMTAASGAYHLGGIGPSDYLLSFEDPHGAYYTQWYDYEDSADYADPISVGVAGTYQADAWMDAVQVQFRSAFTTPTATSDVPSPTLGHPLLLESYLYDTIYGIPLEDEPVVVQSSTDGVQWTLFGAATWDDSGGGHYYLSTVPHDPTARFYRFAVADTADVKASHSAPVLVRFPPRTAAWGPVSVNGVVAPVVAVTRTDVQMVLAANLTDQVGVPVEYAQVNVAQSLDGRTWNPAPAVCRETTPGHYELHVDAGYATMFRLQVVSASSTNLPISAVVNVRSPRAVQCWPSNWMPRHGRAFQVNGWIWPRSKAGKRIATVEIQRKVRGNFVRFAKYRPPIQDGPVRSSRVRMKVKLKNRGTYRMRLSVSGEGLLGPNSSPWAVLNVR